jgi:peptide-methionine (S)-S-oxide reductase
MCVVGLWGVCACAVELQLMVGGTPLLKLYSRPQYRTGIYYHSPEQEEIATKRMEEEATKVKKPVASEMKAAMPFWPAEKYHQQYLEKGGRNGMPQNANKGATETIRCYG